MAFWGVEVKPGRPFTHPPNATKGRLHVSQATLGIGSGTNKSVVQCNVGNKSPVFLCTLFPDKNESCQLNLEFEEADAVVLSVIGSRSVHITGYYLGNSRFSHMVDESESFGEDIAVTESDRSMDDEEYEDSFIDDADPMAVSSSSLEEISNDRSSKKSKVKHRRLRKQFKSHESDKENTPPPNNVVGAREKLQSSDSKDIVDEFFMSLPKKQKDSKVAAAEEDNPLGCCDACEDFIRSKDTARKDQNTAGNLKGSELSAPTRESKTRKRKKEQSENGGPEVEETQFEAQGCIGGEGSNKKNKERKKKKSKTQENSTDIKEEISADKPNGKTSYNGQAEIEQSQVRRFPNGLIVKELEVGPPDGKTAARGKKISVHFVGKIKENGQIFDSNIGMKPLKFRLGRGEVMEGWDDGLEGVRIGGKRRLIIPPSMRKGSIKLDDKSVTPESSLIYDIEVVRVR